MSTDRIIIKSQFVDDVKGIIEQGRQAAYGAVNQIMIETYWNIGRRIVEEEQNGQLRAEYGTQLIDLLAKELTHEYGKGFSPRYLRAFRHFYMIVPSYEIWKSRFPNLTWTHIYRTLRVDNETAARWYLATASQEMWSVRTLDRNISTQYYERHFRQPILPVNNEQPDKQELLKNPIVAEFLGFKQDYSFSEEELESSIIASKDIARYSILKGNEQLFAAKYMPVLPTQEELRREIETQKQIFMLQKQEHGQE